MISTSSASYMKYLIMFTKRRCAFHSNQHYLIFLHLSILFLIHSITQGKHIRCCPLLPTLFLKLFFLCLLFAPHRLTTYLNANPSLAIFLIFLFRSLALLKLAFLWHCSIHLLVFPNKFTFF